MQPEIPDNYLQLKQSDIKPLREKLWLLNNKKCPILDKEIPFEMTQLDHNHKSKSEPFGPDKGTVRYSIDRNQNILLGKIENSVKRTGLSKQEDFDLPTVLRNLADFLERGQYKDEEGNYLIHPNEVPKEPNLSKSNYNKLKKLYSLDESKKRKFPEYPKSKKLTKELKALFIEYGIEPFN